MISRRNAVKLGIATGFGVTSDLSIQSFWMNGAAANESSRQFPDNVGPSLDLPIAIKWQADEVAWSWYESTVNETTLIAAHYDGIVATERTTGIVRWRFTIPPSDGIDANILSPVIAHNCVLFVSIQGETSFIYSLDLYTGNELWSFQLHEAAPPVLNDNTVFTVGMDTGLVGLDIQSGKTSWTPPVSAMAVPVYLQRSRLIAWTIDGFCVFDLDSNLMLWGSSATDLEVNLRDFPYPSLIDGQRIYMPKKEDYSIECVNVHDGSPLWSFHSSEQIRPQALDDDYLFCLSEDGYAYCLDRTSGNVIWRWGPIEHSWQLGGDDRLVNPSNIAGEMFYALTSDDFVVAIEKHTGVERWRREMTMRPQLSGDNIYSLEYGSENYAIACIDALTGDTIWEYEFEAFNWESPGFPIIDNGSFYLGGYPAIAIGNVLPPRLVGYTELKAAPFFSAVTRRSANAGDILDSVGAHEKQDGVTWVEVTIGSDTGWVPVESIDPTTLPPAGGWEIIYRP